MMITRFGFIAALAQLLPAAVCAPGDANAAPALDSPVTDHAVIQRNAAITLSGSARANSDVRVTLADNTARTSADEAGRWEVELAGLPAGGPYTLKIEDSSGELQVSDIMIGDVLLCSGQSNMEYPVYRALNPDPNIAGSEDKNLRLLTVPKDSALTPQPRLPEGAAWVVAGPETVRDFSAVCYFTGRAMREQSNVPVGLIDASWGGSQIEAWLPAEVLDRLGGFAAQLGQLETYRTDPAAAMAAYGEVWEAWWQEEHGSAPWTGAARGPGWKPVPAGFPDWKAYGDPQTEGHLGRLWYAREVELTKAQAGEGVSISLGLFDDSDAVWINGHFLGSTSSWSAHRTYEIPAGVLKPGKNTIIINVLNTYGQGGMMGPADVMAFDFGNSTSLPLGTGWRYKVVGQSDDGGPRPPWESVSGYTTIQNAMIAPLRGIGLKAAIWYQGESNTGRSEAYRGLLQALTETWRGYFRAGLPVVIVQLPVYGAMPEQPVESGWARLREAQRLVARSESKTGLAVTLDAGERRDIHPPNKQLVSARVFEVLERLMDGAAGGLEDGAVPLSARETPQEVILEMPDIGYRVIGADAPIAFEVCGTDGACHWAETAFDGRRVTLKKPVDLEVREVRYCWGDAPVCNFFTEDDTPVAPFSLRLETEDSG